MQKHEKDVLVQVTEMRFSCWRSNKTIPQKNGS